MNPRIGHLEAAYHIFTYLKRHPNVGRIAYDSKRPPVDESVFNNSADWMDFYGEVEEQLPSNMPEPCGNPVTISAFVDANHAGNVVTHRLHSGILIFVQNAPVIWFSKQQNTVEGVTFGSELVACRIAKDLIIALCYKLRMFGVPIHGPVNLYCDNRGWCCEELKYPRVDIAEETQCNQLPCGSRSSSSRNSPCGKGRYRNKSCGYAYKNCDSRKEIHSFDELYVVNCQCIYGLVPKSQVS